jgi:hypothetical protein
LELLIFASIVRRLLSAPVDETLQFSIEYAYGAADGLGRIRA